MSGWKNAPPQVRAALEHLRVKFSGPTDGKVDLDWARRIVARKRSGLPVAQATLEMAREALAKNGEQP